jgi:predicted dehydrogenase
MKLARRAFFATSVAALAAPNDRVRVAIIGTRGRGRALTGEFLAQDNAEVAVLVDVDPTSFTRAAKLIEEKTGKPPATHSDLRRVLDDKTIDAVVIATPDHWHAPAAILAANAGKDVYVEKPCSHSLREGRLMVEAARANQRIMQVGTQARSRASTRRAIDFIQSGAIGKVRMAKAWNVQLRDNIGREPDSTPPANVNYDLWIGPAEPLPFRENRFHYNWHWWWNFGTGDMGNDGVHQMDMARWALGVEAPIRASGWARKVFFDDDQQTPDSMNVTFDYPGGESLIFEQRIWNPYGMAEQENGVAIYGSEGMVEIGRWNKRWGYRHFDRAGKLITANQEPGEGNHARNFLDSIRTRALPNADIAIGHTSTLHAHLGNIIAKTGRNLTFDPKAETIANDAEASALLTRRYRQHWAVPKGV